MFCDFAFLVCFLLLLFCFDLVWFALLLADFALCGLVAVLSAICLCCGLIALIIFGVFIVVTNGSRDLLFWAYFVCCFGV